MIGGILVDGFGWRGLFIGLGLGSLVWIGPWFAWGPRDRSFTTVRTADAPSMLEILSKRSAWGTFIGLFFGNYVWYFLLTWLPSYFVQERHFTMKQMAIMGSLPFWGIAVTGLLGGWLSDRWIAKGVSPTRARKTFVVSGLLLGTLILPATMIQDHVAAMALFMVGSMFFGLYSSNLWTITQTIAGPNAAGKWTGI
jgi:sugar phosphate permease